MQNRGLVEDHIRRAGSRLKAIAVLMKEKSWADVVRECQEAVELTLKALLREALIEVPRIHDVSAILLENRDRLPGRALAEVEFLARVSKALRRDRELAFYGSEDLTPSDFYSEEDASQAFKDAQKVYEIVRESCSR